jgi:hypothetical protein
MPGVALAVSLPLATSAVATLNLSSLNVVGGWIALAVVNLDPIGLCVLFAWKAADQWPKPRMTALWEIIAQKDLGDILSGRARGPRPAEDP